MKYLALVLALVFVGAKAQEHPPDRGAVPCFYWDDQCTSSYGVDFPGNDIAIYRTNSTTDCCNFCKSLEGCMHWVARAVDDGGYVCFLKSVYGFPRYCAECTFSYAKSDACKEFCEATCHNLGEYEPPVCGTDGYTYESPCQMQCSAVMQAAPGECDSPFRNPVDPDPTLSTYPIDPTQYPYLPTSVPVDAETHEAVHVVEAEAVHEAVHEAEAEAVHEPVHEPVHEAEAEAVHEPVHEAEAEAVHEPVHEGEAEAVAEAVAGHGGGAPHPVTESHASDDVSGESHGPSAHVSGSAHAHADRR